MEVRDRDKERRATKLKTRRKWATGLVNPTMLKKTLAMGHLAARVVEALIKLADLFKT